MSLRWRLASVLSVLLLFGWLGASNFVAKETRQGAWWLPDEGLHLGLDLRGGIHLVLSPDLDVALRHELDHVRGSLERELGDVKIEAKRLVVVGESVELEVPEEAGPQLREILKSYDIVDVRDTGPASVSLSLTSDWRSEVRDRAVLQVLEVLRRRVDDPGTGIQESVVTRQGSERILVQIPGVSRVPDIFKPGFLEFKIVQDSAQTEELLRAKYADGLPEGTEIAFEQDSETDRVITAYLVPEDPDITGELLSDARVSFDSRMAEWQVAFTWNAEGGRVFGDLTAKNIQKQLGILLDNRMYSAPVIRDRISRQGTITGNFSSADAADLAVVLRAGALSIPVIFEEERTIGPALGADSIRRGLQAAALGLILVVLFSAFYYRLSGLYASVALLANLTLVFGLMTAFEGTLTLPGIAGIVLTVGMAVDANVIIFERIREELLAGKVVRAAVATGFKRARWTILDANITTFITAIILYNYGTGPIKGFAVTLSVGIVTSVFAALVITRVLFMLYPGDRNVEELSI